MRFTIRDLLWLIVVSGLAVSWFGEHRRSMRAQAVAAERAAELSKDIRFAVNVMTAMGLKEVWDKRNDPPSSMSLSAPHATTGNLLIYPPKPNEM